MTKDRAMRSGKPEHEAAVRKEHGDRLDDCLIMVDREGRVVDFNDAACDLLGYSADRLIELSLPELDTGVFDHNDWKQVVTATSHAAPTWLDTVAKRMDGKEVPVRTRFSRVSHEGEDYLIAALRDLTSQKEAQRSVWQSYEQVKHAQKLDAIGRLAGGVAHDFNNLLTVIIGISELRLKDAKEEGLHADLKQVLSSAQKAADLTRQLLSFSRRHVSIQQAIRLGTIIEGMTNLLSAQFGERITVRSVAEKELGWTVADPAEIEQVVLNLAVNAKDAMPAGGILTLRAKNVPLREAVVNLYNTIPAGDYVMLSVDDTGEGMTQATLERLFEPFFTTKETGRGLGLSIVHGIVRQSGGFFAIDSAPGRGTSFQVLLPRSVPPPRWKPPEQSAAARKGTILLVEDEETVRFFVSRTLRRQGYRVLEASGGDQAIAILKSDPGAIDLLLTDVMMSGMRGPQLRDQALAIRPDLEVLFMSGYAEDRSAVNASADCFIAKPFATEELFAKVSALIRKRLG